MSTKIYERQSNETAGSWAAFQVFRDMVAPRQYTELARVLGKKSTASISIWSKKFNWKARAIAWDIAVDKERRAAEIATVRSMRERQIKTSLRMQDLTSMELEKLIKHSKDNKGALVVTPETLIRLSRAGTDLERLNRGEPGEITETRENDALDYSALTTEELKTFKALRNKARKKEE